MNKNSQYVKEAKSADWAETDLSKARPVVFTKLKPTREPVRLQLPGITLEKSVAWPIAVAFRIKT